MTIAVCGHDLGPFYTSPTGKHCCAWCEDVHTARAEALKEAAEVAKEEKRDWESRSAKGQKNLTGGFMCSIIACRLLSLAAQAIEAKLK